MMDAKKIADLLLQQLFYFIVMLFLAGSHMRLLLHTVYRSHSFTHTLSYSRTQTSSHLISF